MLVGQQRLHAPVVQQPVHEAVENIAFLQSLTVLRKRRRVPRLAVGGQAHEPAEQKVIIHLLHQQTLGTNAVKYLQQRRQQLLRRYRRAAIMRVKLAKVPIHRTENLAGQLPHLPQRMTPGTRSSSVMYENRSL